MSDMGSPVRSFFYSVLTVGTTGFGIGWLMSLSVSPVASIVITSVTGSAAAVVATLSGQGKTGPGEGNASPGPGAPRLQVSPLPIAILVMGIVLGSILGIITRNVDLFGADRLQDPSGEIARWSKLGIDEKLVVQRLFQNRYPGSESGGSASAVVQRASTTYLFASASSECDTLRFVTGDKLRAELKTATTVSLQKLPDIVNDDTTLERVVKEIICAAGS